MEPLNEVLEDLLGRQAFEIGSDCQGLRAEG
jgi:hypothetical protein